MRFAWLNASYPSEKLAPFSEPSVHSVVQKFLTFALLRAFVCFVVNRLFSEQAFQVVGSCGAGGAQAETAPFSCRVPVRSRTWV